jgi:hypothetical protein
MSTANVHLQFDLKDQDGNEITEAQIDAFAAKIQAYADLVDTEVVCGAVIDVYYRGREYSYH